MRSRGEALEESGKCRGYVLAGEAYSLDSLSAYMYKLASGS